MTDQNIIPLFVAGSLLLTLFAFFLIAYLTVQKNKQNAYQLEKRQMVFDHQNSILRTKIEEQENTMDQISKELHDNVKSVLGFADLATNPQQTVLIDKTNKIMGDVIDDLHNISHSMSSSFIRHIGLAETITKELDNIRVAKNMSCSLELKGDPVSLSPETELHVFRIAQEAMQNCLKHAKATSLNFTLEYKPDLFPMKITDNGIGFDKKKIYEMKGLGFLNIFQRARYVHGVLNVESVPLQGSSVMLTLNTRGNGTDNQTGDRG